MSGPGFLTLKGFVSGNDLGGRQGNSGYSRFGGRADLRKEINDIHFTASVTDNSLRDYENAPQIRDGVITAEKRINSECCAALIVQPCLTCIARLTVSCPWRYLYCRDAIAALQAGQRCRVVCLLLHNWHFGAALSWRFADLLCCTVIPR